MPNPRLTDEQCLEALKAAAEHDTVTAAADAVGVPRSTFNDRVREGLKRGLSAPAPPPSEPLTDLAVIERMLGPGATAEQMAERAGVPVDAAHAELARLHALGLNIVRHGDVFTVEKAPPVGHVGDRHRFTTDKNNRIRFGISCDKHYGSKYAREDVTEALYQWFADEGIEHVLDGGNYIDGEAPFNRYDIKVHGLDAQCKYLAESLPQHSGITTYAVSGDDHEGWYAKREGVDIGRYTESVFREQRREDWVNLGYMEAYFDIVNANSGAVARGLLMHPGGGSSYAISYALQKIVEALEGGEKPAFIVAAHYHKMAVFQLRNIWGILPGCAQDQTPFARKKKLDFHIGGMIAEFQQDPETGALIECMPRMRRWFNRGYYNERWSPHGIPTLPARVVNRER